MSVEEVKKILQKYKTWVLNESMENTIPYMQFTQEETAKQILKLFSPPPMSRDVGKKIDKLLEEAETHEWQATHSLEDLRDSILTILNECRRPPPGGK